MKTLSRECLGMLLAAAAFPSAAHAQDEGGDAITVSGSAIVGSDYSFSGFSQTDEEAANQGGTTVSHGSGIYLGNRGSSLGLAKGTAKIGSAACRERVWRKV